MASNVALTGLARDMQARADAGRPIRIGLIGSGEMGTDIVTRVAPPLVVSDLASLQTSTLVPMPFINWTSISLPSPSGFLPPA